MKQGTWRFLRASQLMLRTVVGAGTFALPAAFHAMGILAGTVAFWVMALVVMATHLLYTEVVIKNQTNASHRLPVQAGRILGPWAKWVAYLTHPAQVVGACLAYIILGGEFLAVLVKGLGLAVPVLWWQVGFWAIGAGTVFVGLKAITQVTSRTSWVLVGLLLASAGMYFNRAEASLMLTAHWAVVPGTIGAFVFALFGWEAVPAVVQVLERDIGRARFAVALGSLAGAFLMWLFGVLAYAAIGASVQSGAGQLASVFPAGWFWLLPLAGCLVVLGPFLVLSQDLNAMLTLDAKFPPRIAWAVTFGIPLVLFFLTSRNFLQTVSFIGAVIASLNGMLIALLFLKVFRKERSRAWLWRVAVPLVCMGVFAAILIRRVSAFMEY